MTAPVGAGGGKKNRLADEPSPYLRQHAHNPVDWYPWGEEALGVARALNKPILLSIGYSACHWCHVMAHESFENPAIAQRMNDYFVNIKVDREERPDLDQLYQGVVQLLGRGGGWPLTVFLTPDLRPFYGGTYFPPEDRYGMPGFPRLLEGLHQAFADKRDEVEAQALQFQEGLASLSVHGLELSRSEWTPEDIVHGAQRLERELDRVNGGFGGAPKFPNPMSLALMLRGYRRSGDARLLSGVLLSLERMAQGGIYDQLGGGFHRYSVDERWLVPHFEKMLYDNAQLLHLYAQAQQLDPRPLWAKVCAETVAYLQREMLSPQGSFYAAQDADSEGEEGKFFVWTPEQVQEVLSPAQARLLSLHFEVTERGNFEHGSTILQVVRGVAELSAELGLPPQQVERELAQGREALLQARQQRVAPGLDDKLLAGWNGLVMRGLAHAAGVFGRPDWASLAARCADFVLGAQWKQGRLWRSFQQGQARIEGFVEDYGDVAAGLVAVYQATFEARYLAAAEDMADRAVELFWDSDKAAYLAAQKGQGDLLCPPYALHDNAYPSGASSLTEAQVALAALTGRARHLEQAGRYLSRMRAACQRNPFAHSHLMLAADSYLDGAAEVTLLGTPEERSPFQGLLWKIFVPTVAVSAHNPHDSVPEVLAEALRGRQMVDGKPTAYLCSHFACQPPVTDPADLRRQLELLK